MSKTTMQQYDFNEAIDRRNSDSSKWSHYGDDVLPLWVADMDFRSPDPIVHALQERVSHGVFGYGGQSEELTAVICERMLSQYNWEVNPDDVIFLPGLVSALNVATRAIGERGDGVLVATPIYPPFLSAPVYQHHQLQTAQMVVSRRFDMGTDYLHYEVDFDALEDAISDNSRLFMLCNPQNPVGRVFTPDELRVMAEFCERHDLIICSDDNHCELLLDGAQYTPIASLAPEISARTITLIAPSKTYNLAGLKCGIVIAQNPELRRKLRAASSGIVPQVNLLGYVATLAAYKECGDWAAALLDHLTGNRNYLVDYLATNLPLIDHTIPEGTYLIWLDCRSTGIGGKPQEYFLEHAKVALNDGTRFGAGGEGFVRLNFGCTRATLEQALSQMSHALAGIAT